MQIDSSIRGIIEYKISESPLKNKTVNRKYTFLYATLSEERRLVLEDLKKLPHDTFVTIEENLISIYDIKANPNAKGDVSFQGFLFEQFFYLEDTDSFRIITKERRFEKTIKVLR